MASHSVGQKAALLPCICFRMSDPPIFRAHEIVVMKVLLLLLRMCVKFVFCLVWFGVRSIEDGLERSTRFLFVFLHVFDWSLWSCFYFNLTVTVVIYLGATKCFFCIVRMETLPWRASVISWVVIAAGALYTVGLFGSEWVTLHCGKKETVGRHGKSDFGTRVLIEWFGSGFGTRGLIVGIFNSTNRSTYEISCSLSDCKSQRQTVPWFDLMLENLREVKVKILLF
jgi:hypothetical protein